ncbi:MAG: chromate transporter [Deltaproteobacteria bacterium]|nr:chromate transporter [Deltaproteobacteria bacterium]
MSPYRLKDLVFYFLRLGSLVFGGPVALIGAMHRDLIENKKWLTEEDYKEGLALAQLAPGPLAAQLAIYIGFVHYRFLGATLTGIAFVLPSFVMVVFLGWAYKLYGGLPWMQAVFYGVGASVIGIIAHSAINLTKKTIGKDKLLWLITIFMAVVTVVTESENLWFFLAAGFVPLVIKFPPKNWFGSKKMIALAPFWIGNPAATDETLLKIAAFFAKAGTFVFGSGLAIVPFLYGGVVKEYQWLDAGQFLDAVAVAMITPGPILITVAFIGFLVAGFTGASVAALATFLPCYLFTVIPAPYFKKHGKRPKIAAFVSGVTAAATGAIAGAVIVLGRRSLADIPTLAICLATFVILRTTKKIPEPILVLIAALVGFFVYPMVSHP